MNIKCFIIGCALSCVLLSLHSNANLLIYPVRVSFDETERREKLTLTNTSSQTNTYRLEWREKSALGEGGYKDLSEDEAKGLPIASSMVRFSPRQVTLQPGERQLIKLALRRPRDLAPGEYRSHLLFKAVPPEKDDTKQTNTSTSISIVLSFAIPITVQQDKYDTKISVQAANISFKPSNGTRKVSLDLTREGLHSATGDLSAYWTPKGGKEVMIAKVSDYNVWSELNEIKATLISTEADFSPSDGNLRVRYEGVRDFRGNTYIDEVIEIKRKQIEIENKVK
jgi:fimbrial chaperone protein